jgi:hypothetical protein
MLKAGHPDFEIVDGPLAGRKFKAGEIYPEPPCGWQHWFEPAEKAEVVQMPARGAKTKPRIEDERA